MSRPAETASPETPLYNSSGLDILHPCERLIFVSFFSKSHVQLDPKEQLKLEKIVNESGSIKKEDFVDFAKKSASVKDFSLRGSRSSTPVGRRDIDKAEVVFRVKAASTFLLIQIIILL